MNSSPPAQPQNEPQLCAGGCGFWGSSDTHGFCSVCYKAHQSAHQAAASQPAEPAAAAVAAASPPQPQPPVAEPPAAETAAAAAAAADAPAPQPETAAAAAAPDAAPSQSGGDKPVQENRGRCFCCRKKVGLLGFECRCGYVYCSGHRHAQDHACSFDYATFDKANLAKANTKVVAAKVDKL